MALRNTLENLSVVGSRRGTEAIKAFHTGLTSEQHQRCLIAHKTNKHVGKVPTEHTAIVIRIPALGIQPVRNQQHEALPVPVIAIGVTLIKIYVLESETSHIIC